MRIAVLTSSRADYGIYLPLLNALKLDPFFDLEIIAFGTHPSQWFGNSLAQIKADGFKKVIVVEAMLMGDSPNAIATAQALTQLKFADIWNNNSYDIVFVLGDRYEMFAAASAGLPFGIKYAHIHGGETTLGAIDNVYRHALTHMSTLHFPVCKQYKDKIISLIGTDEGVHNVGALSFDALANMSFLTKEEMLNKYQIDFNIPTLLITFHPETVSFEKNQMYAQTLVSALAVLQSKYQMVITMPNADTMGSYIRQQINAFAADNEKVICIENFGTLGYLSAMKHATMMLGNTSSGFGEASWFPKKVINLGDRQKGRIVTANILTVEIEKDKICDAVTEMESMQLTHFESIYGNGTAAKQIVAILKAYHGTN